MGKLVDDSVLDAALSYIMNNVDIVSVCANTPDTYALATTDGNVCLALKTGVGSGDFTGPLPGTPGQRYISVHKHEVIPVLSAGTATHVALCKSGTQTLIYVTTCTAQALVQGNAVTVPAWSISIGGPT